MDSRFRWPAGLFGAGSVVALAYRFLVTDPVLLSALGVAWLAGIVAAAIQAEALPLFERGGRWGGALAGVTTYVTVTLQSGLSVPAGTAFTVSLTVLGLVLFAAAGGSALTVRAREGGTWPSPAGSAGGATGAAALHDPYYCHYTPMIRPVGIRTTLR